MPDSRHLRPRAVKSTDKVLPRTVAIDGAITRRGLHQTRLWSDRSNRGLGTFEVLRLVECRSVGKSLSINSALNERLSSCVSVSFRSVSVSAFRFRFRYISKKIGICDKNYKKNLKKIKKPFFACMGFLWYG